VTNSYEVSGKLLETKVHAYLVEFEPKIPTNEVITRRTILYGDRKEDKKSNPKLLYDTFGHCEFDNITLYCMGREPKKSHKI